MTSTAVNTGLGGVAPGGAGEAAALDLFHDRVNASWPLIRYLLDDPVYRAAYRRHVDEFVTSVFDPARTPAQFTQATTSLVSYIQRRATAVQQALSVAAR